VQESENKISTIPTIVNGVAVKSSSKYNSVINLEMKLITASII
jgi:hypothetical protein